MRKTKETIFFDTGVILAALNADDEHHIWAKNVIKNHKPPFLACEAVLTEAAYSLRTKLKSQGDVKKAFESLKALLQIKMLVIDFEVKRHYKRIFELMNEYAPNMDFADACVVVMTELVENPKVFTVDVRDFSTYRRFGNGFIPFEAPPIK